MPGFPIGRILVANRGEIACRIIATARRLGIETVAVHSDADRHALHVRMADQTVAIGPPPPAESYLRSDRIIDAAISSGAEAIHPGYGFLAENAGFAEEVRQAGITFIGPSAESIMKMGLKDEAKRIMFEAGVPVLPGYSEPGQEDDDLAAGAAATGYPLLIKPVAGGGGKGMRIVRREQDFAQELDLARREARSAFGNDAVLLERLIENSRHVEVQIFGDHAGNIVHLFERDCSLQRRHQKIVEESPAPSCGKALRSRLHESAVAAGKAINYHGAGTVEFITDASNGALPDAFWFLEMNTRLQVEHPVTELVTGIDLVEWQLRIAAGERLPCRQEEIDCQGHAIEARLYAEDVASGFLPSTGRLTRFDVPDGCRVDSGVEAGDAVSPHYDPMLAKVICAGATRDAARMSLLDALGQIRLSGVSSNIAMLRAILANDGFAAGGIDTGWLGREFLPPTEAAGPPDAAVVLASIELSGLGGGLSAGDGFRIWGGGRWDMLLGQGADTFTASLQTGDGDELTVRLGDAHHRCRHTRSGWQVEGSEPAPFVCADDGQAWVFLDGVWEFERIESVAGADRDAGRQTGIPAPLPGIVRQIVVADGQRRRKGDPVATIEAMKMEHVLRAPSDGEIGQIMVSEGDQVGEGDLVATYSPESQPEEER